MVDTLANLPINMLAQPDQSAQPMPIQLQQALQNAQAQAGQPQPLTETPEFQSIIQAGQQAFGVPGYNEQGQPEPPKNRLKRALSDAIFAIGQGFAQGPQGIAQAATPSGRAYIHEQRAQQAEALRAQQLEQTGMALGRLYGGMGQQARGAATQQRAEAYSQLIPSLVNKYNMQAHQERFRLNTVTGQMWDNLTRQYVPTDPQTGEPIWFLSKDMVEAGKKMGLLGPDAEAGEYGFRMWDKITGRVLGGQGTQTTMGGILPTMKTAQGVKATGKSLGTSPSQVFAQVSQGRLSLAQKTFERDTFGTLFGKDIPSSLVDEQGKTIGWKAPSKPTGSIMTQGQQAQDLIGLFQGVRQEVLAAQAAGKLGPGAGRLHEIMVGKIGADDPQFAELRALGSLATSGMLKAHFGARGGQMMYDHFAALFDPGKMTSGDLLGALHGFETFMSAYAMRARTVGGMKAGQANTPPPAAGTSAPQPVYVNGKLVGHTTDGKTMIPIK